MYVYICSIKNKKTYFYLSRIFFTVCNIMQSNRNNSERPVKYHT